MTTTYRGAASSVLAAAPAAAVVIIAMTTPGAASADTAGTSTSSVDTGALHASSDSELIRSVMNSAGPPPRERLSSRV